LKPRLKLFTPTDENCPIPLRYLDVRRLAKTNSESLSESVIDDFWYDEPQSDRKLSNWWTGKTHIDLLRPKPEPGWEWQGSRLTRKQKTTRPPHIRVEEWSIGTRKTRKEWMSEWDKIGPIWKAKQEKRGIDHIPVKEVDEYEKLTANKRAECSIPEAPAMPTISTEKLSERKSSYNKIPSERNGLIHWQNMSKETVAQINSAVDSIYKHTENVGTKGVTEEFLAMIHQEIPLDKAMRIPDARKAVNREWDKLDDIKAWDFGSVASKWKVKKRAKDEKKVIHFGTVRALCHKKNAQIASEFWSYKGRVVFRGDIVKDQDGNWAVWNEQGK